MQPLMLRLLALLGCLAFVLVSLQPVSAAPQSQATSTPMPTPSQLEVTLSDGETVVILERRVTYGEVFIVIALLIVAGVLLFHAAQVMIANSSGF